jgi:ElaB/YqjD/DUF883 family membrane-anchored ribosome-binding protein
MTMTISNAAEQLADVASQAGERSEEALRRRAGELQKFFDDVEDLLRRVADRGDADISLLRRRVESSIERVKSATRAGMDATVESTRRAAKATDDYVHHNPWTSIGISAAAGLLVGVLLAKR